MARVSTRDTRPELALRRELHARGLRYRVDTRPTDDVRGRADLVFGPARVAVYVDGCFWHGCPQHGVLPRSNREWWRAKLERTARRDGATSTALRARGWEVVRVWEHEDPREAADRIETLVKGRIERDRSVGSHGEA